MKQEKEDVQKSHALMRTFFKRGLKAKVRKKKHKIYKLSLKYLKGNADGEKIETFQSIFNYEKSCILFCVPRMVSDR